MHLLTTVKNLLDSSWNENSVTSLMLYLSLQMGSNTITV